MSKIMIWVGQFDSEADFEKYMDQSAFRQWWKEYDEDNKELRCQFCKELGVMDYDEDSLIMKYSSEGLENLLNVIPADTDKIKEILRAKKITVANAAIMYNSHEGISLQKATRVSKKYLAPSIYSYPYWRLKSNIRFYKGVFCLFGHPLLGLFYF